MVHIMTDADEVFMNWHKCPLAYHGDLKEASRAQVLPCAVSLRCTPACPFLRNGQAGSLLVQETFACWWHSPKPLMEHRKRCGCKNERTVWVTAERNFCAHCFVKEKLKPVTYCPRCRSTDLLFALDGGRSHPCLCRACGYGFPVCSFYSACEEDDRPYCITMIEIPKVRWLALAKLLGVNAVQLKAMIIEQHPVQKPNLFLLHAVKWMKHLDALGISYVVTPDPLKEFREIMECDLYSKIDYSLVEPNPNSRFP